MFGILIFDIVALAIFLILAACWAFKRLTIRYFPKYAIKRQLKKEARRNRATQRALRRKESDKSHLIAWAEEHPNDPVAKGLLAQKATASSVTDKLLGRGNEETDIAAELQRRQEFEDSYERDREARKLRDQELLEWAIKNPGTPEAQRHLKEQLENEARSLSYAENSVHHEKFMLDFRKDENDPERLIHESNLIEAEAKLRNQQDLVRRIQAALDSRPTSNEL